MSERLIAVLDISIVVAVYGFYVGAWIRGTAMSADQSRDAGDFLIFCDGLEAGGLPEYARRGRVIARHLIETLDELVAERSARVALQERCDRTEKLLLARKVRAADDVPF